MKYGFSDEVPNVVIVLCTGCGREIRNPLYDINGKYFHNKTCWLQYVETKYGGNHDSVQHGCRHK